MKKLFSLCLMFVMFSAIYAKEELLEVKKTEWGFEISNVDAKGEKICYGLALPYLDSSSQSFCNTCIIFKSGNDIFDFEKFAKEYVENEADFYEMKDGELIRSYSDEDLYLFKDVDKILVVFIKGNYSNCKALASGMLYIKLSGYSNVSSSNVEKLIQKPLAEKKQNENHSKQPIDEIVYKEKLVEQDKVLKDYGFSSRLDYLNRLERCRPVERKNGYMPKYLLMKDSFINNDHIYVSLDIEYKNNSETIFLDNNKFIYLFYEYSSKGVDCFSIVSDYQLNSFHNIFGGDMVHFYEPMILKYVGKRQYQIPKPVKNPYTSKVMGKGSLIACNTFEIANYYDYIEMMKKFKEVGLLDPDYIDPTRTHYLYLNQYDDILSYIEYKENLQKNDFGEE